MGDPLANFLADPKSYATPFAKGGLVAAGIKLFSNGGSPQLASALGGFPLGLLSSSSIATEDDLALYLYNYPIMTSVLFCATMIYRILFLKFKLNRDTALKAAMFCWALGSFMMFKFVLRGKKK
jgi:hypothetical protein